MADVVLFLVVLDSCPCSCSCSCSWWCICGVTLSRLDCSSPTCPMACTSSERLIARDAPLACCEEGRRRGGVVDNKRGVRRRSHEGDKGSPGATRPGGEPASCLPLCTTSLPSTLSSFSRGGCDPSSSSTALVGAEELRTSNVIFRVFVVFWCRPVRAGLFPTLSLAVRALPRHGMDMLSGRFRSLFQWCSEGHDDSPRSS